MLIIIKRDIPTMISNNNAFLFNFKALLGILVTLAVLFSIIFFFAFFAILTLPIVLIIYLFRKKNI